MCDVIYVLDAYTLIAIYWSISGRFGHGRHAVWWSLRKCHRK